MDIIDLKRLKAHRVQTFHLPPANRFSSPAQALNFVNRRGFIYFWPIKGIDLPSLWVTVAGDRPVADAHDDPAHITWSWKDDALDKRKWYYAKILRGKATLISFAVTPFFYALSENYGSPQDDYLLAYEAGRLSQAAKQIYEALLFNGALNTIDLRKAAKLVNARESEFTKALGQLQMDFKILPVGVSDAGSWHYSHIYEIAARYYPELPERARVISESRARARLLELYFESVGAAQFRDALKLFGWGSDLTIRTLRQLTESGILVKTSHPSHNGEWFSLPKLSK